MDTKDSGTNDSQRPKAQTNESIRLIVGTFNTPELFLLKFKPESNSLEIEARWDAIGNHSWLALDKKKKNLLATCWTDPPSIASYRLDLENDKPKANLINSQTIKNRSGYVTVHHTLKGEDGRVYTAGGASGEVLKLKTETGQLTETLQKMNYLNGGTELTQHGRKIRGNSDAQNTSLDTSSHQDSAKKEKENVLDFGGLRHGAHSIDLSPDGTLMYVADIGRNCIWVHKLDEEGLIVSTLKVPSPRPNDGPRHVWPHPKGEYVYVLQEHSCMVDVFRVNPDQGLLEWIQGVRIIPKDQDEKLFWADEVRCVISTQHLLPDQPDLLVASTRGLEKGTKGYVALFCLTHEGLIHVKSSRRDDPDEKEHKQGWLDIWQTPTSGGWANAIEPCYTLLHSPTPHPNKSSRIIEGQYMALTDSEEGLVMILSIESDYSTGSKHIVEVTRIGLGKTNDGQIRGAATAVWL